MKTTIKTVEEDNSDAVITESADDQESIYVTSISASYDGTTSDMTLQIEEGNTVIWKIYIKDDSNVQYDWTSPLKLSLGEDLTVTLSASGTGGTSGRLNVAYGKGE